MNGTAVEKIAILRFFLPLVVIFIFSPPGTFRATTLRTMSSTNDATHQQTKNYEPTSSHFKPRYTGPSPGEMTEEQKSLRASILASRPHTGLSGPFGPWIAVPEIARPSQELGRTLRYGTSLSARESELVILLTGAKFKCEAEFDIHVGEARRAGLGWDVIRSIPRGVLLSESQKKQEGIRSEEFSLEKVKKSVIPLLAKEHDDTQKKRNEIKEREVAIVLFAAELLDGNTVSDETYDTTKQTMDGEDSVLVEVTAIIGYYAYVSYTLNVFKIAPSVSGALQ